MIKENENFQQPEGSTVQVWRYMDLTQLLDLLLTSELFFTRTDQFPDKLEGSWPEKDILEREKFADGIKDDGAREALRSALQPNSGMSKWIETRRRFTAISCWHMNDVESALMWDVYSGEGVAIKSTFDDLKNCIDKSTDFYLGKVQYIDFQNESTKSSNVRLSQFIHKSIHYRDEREVRAVIITDEEGPIRGPGVKVKVDLNRLIDAIYLSPRIPEWKGNLIREIIDRLDMNFKINDTELNINPKY